MTAKNIYDLIGVVILTKVDTTLKKIIKEFRKILEGNPNFTGRLTTDFCLGGVTSIDKKEKIKIK